MLKIISHATKNIYEIDVKKNGENQMTCPECSNSRKPENKRKKVFSWNETNKVGYCVHCCASFGEYKPYKEEKVYQVPEWKNITNLSDKAVKWFLGRMISQSTLNKVKIYSDTEWMPQFNKKIEVICFPYFKDSVLTNIKYRGAQKSFKLFKDAELIFFNFDCIIKNKEIIITEGEIDALSFIEIGYDNVISVPNGAGGKNLEYLDNYIELFDGKSLIIATDNDSKGIELRLELIRRFGQERCKVINFNDCKDANEMLCKNGGLELRKCFENAREIPVEGVININNQYDEIYDLYLNGLQPGKYIGFTEIDEKISWETGRLLTVTGIPGHGKSEFLDWVLVNLNIKHSWKVGYFSPENYPIKYHFSKISSKIIGKEFNTHKITQSEFEKGFDYIQENFYWVYPESDMSIENILEKAKFLIKKHGIKVFVIDPYNKLEHTKNKGENETEYISRFLDLLSNFAKRNDILICLVAHPRKIEKLANKKFDVPTLYDISGSANFYNKTDYGITVYRHFGDKETSENHIEIHIQKVKFKHLGETALIDLKYNFYNGRFEKIDASIDNWNYSNYMEPKEEIAQIQNINHTIEPNKDFDYTPINEQEPF